MESATDWSLRPGGSSAELIASLSRAGASPRHEAPRKDIQVDRPSRTVDVPSGSESVRDLVRRRTGDAAPSWNLALVQRDEVWDQVRMRHLLDSLLAGYPIGSILLCRVKDPSRAIQPQDGVRHVVDADPTAWQLLDGQQRINALFSMLTSQGNYGCFYLHMTMPRQAPGAMQRRSTKDHGLRHIAWRSGPEEPVSDRPRHIALNRWAEWAESELTETSQFNEYNVLAALSSLDEDFMAPLCGLDATQAADRLNALVTAWFKPSVPVLHTEVESPLDVLEVFTRINLGGVQIGGADVYFAAVKTFWTEAEERLARVDRATPFLTHRFGSLRFISRLASRAIDLGDPLPLHAESLTGRSGEPLLRAMQELTRDGSLPIARIGALSSWMREHSKLGYTLHLVTAELWDDVLGWAAASVRTDNDWYAENRPLIDAYLLGATLFRYRAVMRDRFHRLAFSEALTAGASGKPFPLEQILAVSRSGDGLSRRRRQVPSLANGGGQSVADSNGRILTCLAQRIEYLSEDQVDWDHIFPSAQAQRMWTMGDGRRKHHPSRQLVNTAGNLWALNAGANRSVQDDPPKAKFPKLEGWAANPGVAYPVWDRKRWSLSDEEVRQFIEVDDLLDDTPANIERGMTLFSTLVRARTKRLLDEALQRFPGTDQFAADSGVLPEGPTPRVPFLDALGLSDPTPASSTHDQDRAANASWDDWDTNRDEMKGVVRKVVKALTKGKRRLPCKELRRHGFEFGGYVWVGAPAKDTYIGIGIRESTGDGSNTPYWLQVNTVTAGFDAALQQLTASKYADHVRYWTVTEHDPGGHLGLPLEAPPHLPTQQLVDHLTEQARGIMAVLTPAGVDDTSV